MAALDAAATGEDRAHLLRRVRRPRTRRASLDAGDGSLGGFVVRAPWGGGATIAPRLEDAEAILHARRVAQRPRQAASGPGCWPRTRPGSSACSRPAGPRPGGRPRLVRGEPLALAARGDLGPVQPRPRLTGGGVLRRAQLARPDGRQRPPRLGEVDPVVAGGEPEREVVALRAPLAVHADAGAVASRRTAPTARDWRARSASNQATSSVRVVVAVAEAGDPQGLVVADDLGLVLGDDPAVAAARRRARRRRCGRGTRGPTIRPAPAASAGRRPASAERARGWPPASTACTSAGSSSPSAASRLGLVGRGLRRPDRDSARSVVDGHGASVDPRRRAARRNPASSRTGDAELLGLRQLRAGALAGDDVVGLLRDRAGGLAAGGADRLLRLLAAEALERAGHDERLAVERPGRRLAGRPDDRPLRLDADLDELARGRRASPRR